MRKERERDSFSPGSYSQSFGFYSKTGSWTQIFKRSL